MAIAPTGAIFKTLTFDSVLSSTYGIYITGEAVFNAPTRDVNMITIPGRNGLFAQDNGRFDNITVTYPAGLFGATEADFRAGIEALRDQFCSRVGYKKLSDDYNPNEFRMAVYKSGLEVTPETLRAGTFDLTFECKPQRFLTSGETKTTITNLVTLTNPTPYDAKPLIETTGTGTLTITNHTTNESSAITVDSVNLGEVQIADAMTGTKRPGQTFSVTDTIDSSVLNSGDDIVLNGMVVSYLPGNPLNFTADSITSATGDATAYISGKSFNFDFGALSFDMGTSTTKTASATLGYTKNGTSGTKNVTITITYNGAATITAAGTNDSSTLGYRADFGEVLAVSTKSMSPIYIDCESGLCYGTYSGEYHNASSAVTLPAKLPVLWASAQADFTIGGLSSVKITPRWWRV